MTEPMMAAPEPSFDDESGTSPWQERKALVVVAAVGGAAVLGLGAWLLFFSGGGAAEEDGLVASARKPSAVVSPVAEASKPPVTTLPSVPADSNGRDPFDPLYEPVAPSLPEPVTPPAGDTTTTTPGGSTTTTPDQGQQATGKVRVRLVRVDLNSFRAQVSVNGGKAFWINEGASFGPRNSLTLGGVYAEDGGYGTFFVGDDEEGTATDIYVGATRKF